MSKQQEVVERESKPVMQGETVRLSVVKGMVRPVVFGSGESERKGTVCDFLDKEVYVMHHIPKNLRQKYSLNVTEEVCIRIIASRVYVKFVNTDPQRGSAVLAPFSGYSHLSLCKK
jgi:hypothetical protein